MYALFRLLGDFQTFFLLVKLFYFTYFTHFYLRLNTTQSDLYNQWIEIVTSSLAYNLLYMQKESGSLTSKQLSSEVKLAMFTKFYTMNILHEANPWISVYGVQSKVIFIKMVQLLIKAMHFSELCVLTTVISK